MEGLLTDIKIQNGNNFDAVPFGASVAHYHDEASYVGSPRGPMFDADVAQLVERQTFTVTLTMMISGGRGFEPRRGCSK